MTTLSTMIDVATLDHCCDFVGCDGTICQVCNRCVSWCKGIQCTTKFGRHIPPPPPRIEVPIFTEKDRAFEYVLKSTEPLVPFCRRSIETITEHFITMACFQPNTYNASRAFVSQKLSKRGRLALSRGADAYDTFQLDLLPTETVERVTLFLGISVPTDPVVRKEYIENSLKNNANITPTDGKNEWIFSEEKAETVWMPIRVINNPQPIFSFFDAPFILLKNFRLSIQVDWKFCKMDGNRVLFCDTIIVDHETRKAMYENQNKKSECLKPFIANFLMKV